MAMTRQSIKKDSIIMRTIEELVPQEHDVRKLDSCMDWDFIYPLVKGFFEEMEFPIPFDSDTYLKDQYKDYMVLPSEEKRQIHAIYIHANLNK